MSQFINSVKEVKNNYSKYDGWEQHQADDAAKREHLSKTLDMPKDKVELTEAKAKTVIRAAEILDKKSEDNCENTEQSVSIISTLVLIPLAMLPGVLMPFLEKSKKLTPKKINLINLAQIGAIMLSGIGFTLWGNEKQKEASRLGRFQAKNHELKDVKNFVTYTPEQIEAAKILLKSMPDKKDKKGIGQAFKNMKQMSADKKEYKKWLEERIKNPEDTEKLLKVAFTPEQIAQGEEDKEIIVNIVNDINIEAENYSENMENAADTLTMLSFLGSIPLAVVLNKILKNMKNIPSSMKPFVPVMAGAMVTLGVLGWGTAEQKKASRVGRFMKRKEILNNTKMLMAYSDEQLKKVDSVKAPVQKQGFFEKIGSNLKFLGTYLKEKKEYNKYVKTEAKENEKLHDALSKTEVSAEQLENAKHIQEKTFKAFDKVDEMSQRYSEDIEAGTEIAKQLASTAWNFASIAAMVSVPVLILKGKIPVHKIAKKLSDFTLNKGSSIRAFVDKAYDTVSKDKTLKQDVCKSILDKKTRDKLAQNPVVSDLIIDAAKIAPEFMTTEKLAAHFKNDGFSKWIRNLTLDIAKLKANMNIKNKLSSEQIKQLDKEMLEKIKFNRENYKTLINSLIIGGVPMAGVLFGVPFAFSSWLTNIQKKAGKIGIMKAMEEIDNPQFFVNAERTNSQTENVKEKSAA